MASDTETELEGLFENCQESTSMRTAPGKDDPPTTTHAGDNGQYSGIQHSQRNGKKKIS